MKRLVQRGTAACLEPHDPACAFEGPGCPACSYFEDVVEGCDGCADETQQLRTTTHGERMCAACITEGEK